MAFLMALSHRKNIRIEARRLPTRRFLGLCVPDESVISLWKTVPITLTFHFCANARVTEASPFGLNKVLVWQSPSRNTDCQMCKGHLLRWLDYGQPNDAWSPDPSPFSGQIVQKLQVRFSLFQVGKIT